MAMQNPILTLDQLTDEQRACLQDVNRRAEAHGMLDDLRDREGFNVDALRATLPPLGRVRAIIETYTNMREHHTGGGCMAYMQPLDDGGYLLITDAEDAAIPADDAETVAVGHYDCKGSEAEYPETGGSIVIPTAELEAWIDERLGT